MTAPAIRKSKQERKREIAGAVLELIGLHGASHLTAARISERMGLSSGAIFRHFPNTDAMLGAAADLAVKRTRDCFPADDLPPLERITRLLLSRIEVIRAHPGMRWLLLSEQAKLTIPERAMADVSAVMRDSHQFLMRAVQEAVARGELRSDVAPSTMLVYFSGLVQTLTAQPSTESPSIASVSTTRASSGQASTDQALTKHGRHRGDSAASPPPSSPAEILDTLVQLLATGPPRTQ